MPVLCFNLSITLVKYLTEEEWDPETCGGNVWGDDFKILNSQTSLYPLA